MSSPTSMYFRTPKQYEQVVSIMHKVVLFFGFLILFLSIILVGRVLYGTVEPDYVARNVKGQLYQMLQIKPGTQEELSKMFLTDAVQEIFNLTSDTYLQKIPTLNAYFTDDGYQNYIDILKDLGIDKRIKEGPTVLTTYIVDIPVVDKQASKMYDKTFVWVYYVNVAHTVQTSSGSTVVERKYKISMKHMGLIKKPLGLGIYSIKAV